MWLVSGFMYTLASSTLQPLRLPLAEECDIYFQGERRVRYILRLRFTVEPLLDTPPKLDQTKGQYIWLGFFWSAPILLL